MNSRNIKLLAFAAFTALSFAPICFSDSDNATFHVVLGVTINGTNAFNFILYELDQYAPSTNATPAAARNRILKQVMILKCYEARSRTVSFTSEEVGALTNLIIANPANLNSNIVNQLKAIFK